MQYRYFTKDKLKVSVLGFGCMRFPIINEDSGSIDEIKATEMLHYAIDNGVNYIDTAYPYHGGTSEAFVGRALSNGYREKVYLATKLPVWLCETYKDFEKYLDEQLERLNVDYIDFYLLHSLNEKSWNNIIELKIFNFLEDAKRKGKIKYIGFSFHDELPVFKTIIDSYNWDFCQIQLNYMDTNYQAGLAGLRYAVDKDISVVVMEPIKGGKLAFPSKEVQDIWDKGKTERTAVQWALDWVYNFPDVSLLLSGMSTLEQVKQNIETARGAMANSLTEDDLKLVQEVTALYEKNIKVGCTSCEYCLPCPEGVAIPSIFDMYNNAHVYGTVDDSRERYRSLIKAGKDQTKCVECGICEGLCPQHLEIIRDLKEAHDFLIK